MRLVAEASIWVPKELSRQASRRIAALVNEVAFSFWAPCQNRCRLSSTALYASILDTAGCEHSYRLTGADPSPCFIATSNGQLKINDSAVPQRAQCCAVQFSNADATCSRRLCSLGRAQFRYRAILPPAQLTRSAAGSCTSYWGTDRPQSVDH